MRDVLVEIIAWCAVVLVSIGCAGGLLFLCSLMGLFPS